MSGLAGKTVVLGITGGIAAYKAAELCRLLIKAGITVRVVMTEAATRFIAPLTLQTLSGAPVARDLFDADEEARIGHIRLGDEADLIVIAPATANTIARFAAGLADDLLAAVVLASRAPVLLAPAMNVNMWQNPITQQNLGRLIALGRFSTVGPDAGPLACGWVGEGRLMDPAEIAAAAFRQLTPQDLAGRRVVVTAGPTFEPIDEVRFIGNRSSGKMGFALAESAARRGAEVTLIAGPVAEPTPAGGGITRRDVETTADLRSALLGAAADADVVVMAAAVADFRPAARLPGKLSRRAVAAAGPGMAAATAQTLPLQPNPDLLAELGRARRGSRPLLVGFAAHVRPAIGNHGDRGNHGNNDGGVGRSGGNPEGDLGADSDSLLGQAQRKLHEKACDVMVANDVSAPGLGFGSDDNAVTLVFADGQSESIPLAPKIQIAHAIWDRLIARLPERGRVSGRGEIPRRTVVARPTVSRASPGRRRRG